MRNTLALLVALLPLASCSLFEDRDRIVIMGIEDIEVPEQAEAYQAFDVAFSGTLGNGCQQFEKLEMVRSEHRAQFTMLARQPDGGCTDDIREVRWRGQLIVERTGPFVLDFRQGRGASVQREVVIR